MCAEVGFSSPLQVFTVGQGFDILPTSSASSIIDACKTLLFYLQRGGREPAVQMACGGLFIDCVHTACTLFPFQPRNPAPSSPSCPIKLKNLGKWNETSKSWLLLWLTWYDLYYNLDPVLLRSLTRSSAASHQLPPSPLSHSFHYLDWLLWNRP